MRDTMSPLNNTTSPDDNRQDGPKFVGYSLLGPMDPGTTVNRNSVGSIPNPQAQRRLLNDIECENELPLKWSWQKKWWVLAVIAVVQTSMNFNTTLYSNGMVGMMNEFHASEFQVILGAAIFLITYAFGCELWAPWSEELGRKIVLQLSLLFVNIFCLPVALSRNMTYVLIGRALGGLASAGGSVTLGIVADMYDPEDHQYAVAFVSLSSVGGSIFGAIVGGFVEYNLYWRWAMWIQLMFGVFVQVLHLTVPETRHTLIMDKIAKKRRAENPHHYGNVYGPGEIKSKRERFWNRKAILATWSRPFKMLYTEPIVMYLSLLSGFADALIFMCVQSFSLVYRSWGFNTWQLGLTFLPIGLGYIVGWASFLPAIRRNIRHRDRCRNDPRADAEQKNRANFEGRLWWLLWTVPLLVIGLVLFTATSGGPPMPFWPTMLATLLIGIGNYAIYMATIDYMVAAYGEYSASATGGNGFARDFLAGILTFAAKPFYRDIGARRGGSFHIQMPTGILTVISALLAASVYWIYYRGPAMRKHSPFAMHLEHEREEKAASRHASGVGSRITSPQHGMSQVDLRVDASIDERLGSSGRPTEVKRSQSGPPDV